MQTNAVKFLKEGITPYEFAWAFNLYCFNYERGLGGSPADKMERFLKAEAKPIITEDERVILRNTAKEYFKIGRNVEGDIYFVEMIDTIHEGQTNIDIFTDNVFQFIKNGEEYSIEELLKGE